MANGFENVVYTSYFLVKRVRITIKVYPWPGGDSHMKGAGMLVGNFELRASLVKILISSFAHKMDFAHNFSADFF